MAAQPLSPWAERFIEALNDKSRPVSILKQDAQEHSGFAIEFPRRDPKFYDNLLFGEDGHTRPKNGAEFDRLFISELLQKRCYGGTPTWKLASLNYYLWASDELGIMPSHLEFDYPDWFREEYEKMRIEVDETTWFHFLQKSRWYNLTDHPRRPTQPVAKGGPWTVDDPAIWENLSVSIELANRMLKALIFDRHGALETLLFGRLLYWRSIPSRAASRPFEDAIVLLSPEMELELATREFRPPWQSEFSKLPEEQMTEECT
ncbi:hypothetical protein F4782DRAFT_446123 [Xylaria castorea]|nr:hypothetical protein F4782DRAFT_446123 [Xylaria castorea]